MPKRKKSKSKKGRKRLQYDTSKQARARRRHRKRRSGSTVRGHHKRMLGEAETLSYLLHQLLKTADSPEGKPYHYHPRHHSKDPEYGFSSDRLQGFKKGFPAPDVSFLRSQGEGLPPHSANYPQWDHPHVGIV